MSSWALGSCILTYFVILNIPESEKFLISKEIKKALLAVTYIIQMFHWTEIWWLHEFLLRIYFCRPLLNKLDTDSNVHLKKACVAHCNVLLSDTNNSVASFKSRQSIWYTHDVTDSAPALHLSLLPPLPSPHQQLLHKRTLSQPDASVVHVFSRLAQAASVE